MSPAPTPRDVRFFESPGELRDWFDANHQTAHELWLGNHKQATGKRTISWSEAVDEALCVGWIDGIAKRLDEATYAQRFTPRRKGSNWSAINVAKVETLTAQGRMRPAGLAAYAERRPANTAVYSYEREAAVFEDEEMRRFQADEAAWTDWERRPASYRRGATYWVTSAKRAATRDRRLEQLITASAAGRKPRALVPPAERQD